MATGTVKGDGFTDITSTLTFYDTYFESHGDLSVYTNGIIGFVNINFKAKSNVGANVTLVSGIPATGTFQGVIVNAFGNARRVVLSNGSLKTEEALPASGWYNGNIIFVHS